MKDISNIDLTLNPIKMPEVRGRFSLENILQKSYPMLIAANKIGAEIIVREGQVFLLDYPFLLGNTQFRERFKGLLELTNSKHFTVHAIVSSTGMSKEQMRNILKSEKSLLPIDTTVFVTLAYYESGVRNMTFGEIIELLYGLVGRYTFIKDVYTISYTEVPTKNNLANVSQYILTNVNNIEGLILLDKNGKYYEGTVKPENLSAIILNPVEEIWGEIIKVDSSFHYLPGENLALADRLLIQFGETELSYDLNKEPLMVRGYIHEMSKDIVGSSVLCENLYLPGNGKAIIKKILKMNY